MRVRPAAESLPPEDADIIVDNAATGSTLKANNLEVFDTLQLSTTRLYASKAAWADPAKRVRIEQVRPLRLEGVGWQATAARGPGACERAHLRYGTRAGRDVSALVPRASPASSPLWMTAPTARHGPMPSIPSRPPLTSPPTFCTYDSSQLGLLLKSVLDARGRLMVTFNVPDAPTLDKVLGFLPSLRAPTVSSLHHGAGFAVQVAAQAAAVPELVPQIKEHGGQDIVISSIRMLIA